MLPGDGPAPFDDEGWFFEPWWPGVLATIVIDDGRVELHRGPADRSPARVPGAAVGGRPGRRGAQAVIPGTLLVLDADGRPDAGGTPPATGRPG